MTNSPGYKEYIKGTDLLELKKYKQALTYLKKSLKLNPNQPGTLHNLGFVYERLDQTDMAIEHYHQALKIVPDLPDSHINLANIYQNLNQTTKSLFHYQKVLDSNPTHPQALLGKSICLIKNNKFLEALPILKNLLKSNPTETVYYLLATQYAEKQGNYKLSLKYFKEGVKAFPHSKNLLTNMQYYSQVICDWKTSASCSQKLSKIKSQKTNPPTPYANIVVNKDPQQNIENATTFSQQQFSHIKPLPKAKTEPNKKIRIGYISTDYKNHVITHHIMSLFRHHNKKRFKIIAYDYGNNASDKYTQFIKNKSDKFTNLDFLSNTEAAKIIQNDQIDILVDLTGFTQNSRFEILAYHPSPIQINYLGFPSSTGADFIDYIIADKVLIPKKDKKYYSEKVLYLPYGYQISSYDEFNIPKTPSRSSQNLPEDKFVFCSFNNSYKITQKIFSTWMNVLKQVPDSVLWLSPLNPQAQKNIRKTANSHSINPQRIIFSNFTSIENHLSRLPLANLALDTPSYNGGSTTSNALYMGVPVVTIEGVHYPSRMTTSFLSFLNQKSLITKDIKSYQKLCIDLAIEPQKLKKIRSSLQTTVKKAPMFDPQKMTQAIENIYQKIYSNRK